MKKTEKKDHTFIIAVFCIIATLLILFHAFLLKPTTKWVKGIFGSDQSSASPSTQIVTDVSEETMMEYVAYIAGIAPFSIRIVETTDEFTVTSLSGAATYERHVKFQVLPKQTYRFSSIPIEQLVNNGLEAVSSSGDDQSFSWEGVTISTNKADLVWDVAVNGISGNGILGLTVGKASATCRVNLPKLFPIWKEVVYISPIKEEVHVGGVRTPTRDSMIAPDLSTGYCGFRVRAVVGQTVWFEVLYDNHPPLSMRKRWPGLKIDFDFRGGGMGFSSVQFEGGKKMVAGNAAVFDDDYTAVKLERTGFLSPNAVLFRYYDREKQPICDLVCVTLQR